MSYKRPVFLAQRSMSRHSHAGIPLTVHFGSGKSWRNFHMATVCWRTLSRSAISLTPTGSGTDGFFSAGDRFLRGWFCGHKRALVKPAVVGEPRVVCLVPAFAVDPPVTRPAEHGAGSVCLKATAQPHDSETATGKSPQFTALVEAFKSTATDGERIVKRDHGVGVCDIARSVHVETLSRASRADHTPVSLLGHEEAEQ